VPKPRGRPLKRREGKDEKRAEKRTDTDLSAL
jgi:hypothetical protein